VPTLTAQQLLDVASSFGLLEDFVIDLTQQLSKLNDSLEVPDLGHVLPVQVGHTGNQNR
jgi:hypothetical protein